MNDTHFSIIHNCKCIIHYPSFYHSLAHACGHRSVLFFFHNLTHEDAPLIRYKLNPLFLDMFIAPLPNRSIQIDLTMYYKQN